MVALKMSVLGVGVLAVVLTAAWRPTCILSFLAGCDK